MYYRDLETIAGEKARYDAAHKAIAAKRLADLAARRKATKAKK